MRPYFRQLLLLLIIQLCLKTWPLEIVALAQDKDHFDSSSNETARNPTSVDVPANNVSAFVDSLVRSNRADQVTQLAIHSHEKIQPDLRPLVQLRRLNSMSLARVPIDDEDLAILATCVGLEDLDLSETPISDKGVADHLLAHIGRTSIEAADSEPCGSGTVSLSVLD